MQHARLLRSLLLLLALASVAAPLLAQAPPGLVRGQDDVAGPPRSSLFRTPVSTATRTPAEAPPLASRSLVGAGAGVDLEGRPVLLGPGYRMLFEPGRAAFHPALGTAVETAQEVAFELLEVAVGGHVLVAGPAPTAPRPAGLTITYEHVGGLLERYEARDDGVEQTFVVPEPLGVGDLVVRGRLTSTLPFVRADERGLSFALDGVGGVRVGTVTGVDAAGRSVAGELRFDGETVEYRLPAAFVAEAAYPLVVDPLFGTESQLSTFDLATDRPDVAYLATTDQYLACWETTYALGDVDVTARRVAASGAPIGPALSLRVSVGLVSAFPAVASVRGSGSFVAAWSEGSLLGGRDVWVRSFDAGSLVFSQPSLVASGTITTRPDVGGEAIVDPSATEALVAWTHGTTGVWAAQVTPSGGSAADVVFDHTTLMSGADHRNVAISKSGGGPGRWTVVAQRYFDTPAPGDFDLRYAIVDWELDVDAGPFSLTHVGFDAEDPDVDGNGARHLVAYSLEEPNGFHEARRVFLDAAGLPSNAGLVVPNPFIEEWSPAVAHSDDRWEVAYLRGSNTAVTGVTLVHYCATSETICSGLGGFSGDVRAPALATRWSGDTDDETDEGLMLWPEHGTVHEVFARPFDGTFVAPYWSNGGGCGAAIVVTPQNEWNLGIADFGWRLDVADPGATLAILNARVTNGAVPDPGPLFACGGCELMVTQGIVEVFPVVGSVGTLATPIPADYDLLTAGVTAQFFVLPTTASPCGVIANVSASERVSFYVGQ